MSPRRSSYLGVAIASGTSDIGNEEGHCQRGVLWIKAEVVVLVALGMLPANGPRILAAARRHLALRAARPLLYLVASVAQNIGF